MSLSDPTTNDNNSNSNSKLSIDTTTSTSTANTPHTAGNSTFIGTTPTAGGKTLAREETVQCVHCLRRVSKGDYPNHNKTCELRLELCR